MTLTIEILTKGQVEEEELKSTILRIQTAVRGHGNEF